MLFEYSRNTNYSVVDLDLIDELYRRAYAEKVAGAERLRILNVSRLLDVRDGAGGVRVKVGFLPTGEVADLDADAVVYATGYRERDPFGLLGEAGGDCLAGPDGRPVVERDYRIATAPGRSWGVYLQGATEHSHGIASSLLSMTAVRTGEIVRSIARRSAPVTQAF
jgi:L-ornithine N5-oxygenase